jgi:hypothetical protein
VVEKNCSEEFQESFEIVPDIFLNKRETIRIVLTLSKVFLSIIGRVLVLLKLIWDSSKVLW